MPIILALLLTGAAATMLEGEELPRAALRVANRQKPAWSPCRTAMVTMTAGDAEIRSVALRDREGGPWIIAGEVTVAPHSTATIPVPLPAIADEQSFAIRLHTLKTTIAQTGTISFADLANHSAWFRPDLYSEAGERRLNWTTDEKRDVFLIASLAVLAAAGTLFIPAGRLRGGAVTIIAAIATGVFLIVLQGQPSAALKPLPGHEGIWVLSARRSMTWTTDRPWRPLYYNARQWEQSEIRIDLKGRTEVPLSPDSIRILGEWPHSGDID